MIWQFTRAIVWEFVVFEKCFVPCEKCAASSNFRVVGQNFRCYCSSELRFPLQSPDPHGSKAKHVMTTPSVRLCPFSTPRQARRNKAVLQTHVHTKDG